MSKSASELENVRLAQPAAAGQTSVLVVDDCAGDRELLSYVLRKAGFRVLVANSAQQAQQLAGEAGHIALLVTDFDMPGMNGVELANWFRNWSPLSKVLLVAGAPRALDAYLAITGWPPLLDKAQAFTQLTTVTQELLAGLPTHRAQLPAGEITKRAAAETTARGEILERGNHSSVWAQGIYE